MQQVAVRNERVQITDVNNPVQQKSGRGRRLKHSNFHLVVNTNVQHNQGSQELEEECKKLRQAADVMLYGKNIGHFINILEPGASFSPTWIKGIETKGAVERGGKFNQVHVHMMICIAHYTKVQIDVGKVKNFFCNRMGLQNVYVHVNVHRGAGDAASVLEHYIKKNQSQ